MSDAPLTTGDAERKSNLARTSGSADSLAFRPPEPAKRGLVKVMGIPTTALGGVLRRDTSRGASRLIGDEEFISLLAQTPPYKYLAGSGTEAQNNEVRRDIVSVQCVSALESCRFASKRLKWALQEVIEELTSKINEDQSQPSKDESPQDETRRLEQAAIVIHSAGIMNMIQKAAAELNDNGLWGVVSEFLENTDPSLATKLRELTAVDPRVANGALRGLFQSLVATSETLLAGKDQVSSLLIANLVLKRIVHLFENLNIGTAATPGEVEDTRDLAVALFAEQLAREVRADDPYQSPLFSVLSASADSAWRLFEYVSTSFSSRAEADFPVPVDLGLKGSERIRNDRLLRQIEATKTFLAVGCRLWPGEFSQLVQRRYDAASIEHQAVYLAGLSHGIDTDPERGEFVIAKSLEFLQIKPSGLKVRRTQQLQQQIEDNLVAVADPLLAFLTRNSHAVFKTIGVELREKLLWKILIPACEGPQGEARRPLVLALFEDELVRCGPGLFGHEGLHRLLNGSFVRSLDPASRARLLAPLFDGVAQVRAAELASKAEQDDDGPLVSRRVAEMFTPLLNAFGAPAVIFGIQYAEQVHEKRPRDAVSILQLLGESIRTVQGIEAKEQRQVQDAVGEHLVPMFNWYERSEQSAPPSSSGRVRPNWQAKELAREVSEPTSDDIDEALFDPEEEDVSEEQQRPPAPSWRAKAAIGASIRNFLLSPCMQADAAQRIIKNIQGSGTETLLTRFVAEARFKLNWTENGPDDHNLAEALQSCSLVKKPGKEFDIPAKDDLLVVFKWVGDAVRTAGFSPWKNPAESKLFEFVAENFAVLRENGFRAAPVPMRDIVWSQWVNEAALDLLLSMFEASPAAASRKPIDLALYRALMGYVKQYRAEDRHTLSEHAVTQGMKRLFSCEIDPQVPNNLVFRLAERINDEAHSGRLQRVQSWVSTEVVNVIDFVLARTTPETRVIFTVDDKVGRNLHHTLNACRDAIERRFGIGDTRWSGRSADSAKFELPPPGPRPDTPPALP